MSAISPRQIPGRSAPGQSPPVRALLFALLMTALAAHVLAAEPGAPATLDGKTLFRTKCGICHLEGGTGTFMLSRRLAPEKSLLEKRTDLDPKFIEQVVRNGIVSMPRFS